MQWRWQRIPPPPSLNRWSSSVAIWFTSSISHARSARIASSTFAPISRARSRSSSRALATLSAPRPSPCPAAIHAAVPPDSANTGAGERSFHSAAARTRQHAVGRGEHDRLCRRQRGERLGQACADGVRARRKCVRRCNRRLQSTSTTTALPACNRACSAAASIEGTDPAIQPEHARHVRPGRARRSERVQRHHRDLPAHLLHPVRGHRGADAIVVHQHDARAPGGGVPIGFLHQLPAGDVLHAWHMPGGVLGRRAHVEHIQRA